MLQNNSPNSLKKFICECCDYKCCKKSDFDKHLLSNKHKSNETGNIKVAIVDMVCDNCNKLYKSRVGLWRHKKLCIEPICNISEYKEPKCKDPEPIPDIVELLINENKEFKNVILDLFKSNSEMQKQMMEMYKQGNGGVHNSNINSHNKTFNLQFFLNEQCKDAMNIMDFVDTFKLEFSDLERIGEVGYVEGISNIVINKLNELDIHKRPIHCSDAKREIMHVKDKDVWTKDSPTNDKIRLALKHITKKNSDMIRPWANAHPGVLNSDHRLSDKYQIMIIEAMGGNKNKTMREREDKIIKKISKMVLIDKGGIPP